jgi:hypothetical protein
MWSKYPIDKQQTYPSMNILEEQSSMKANSFKSLTWIALLLK